MRHSLLIMSVLTIIYTSVALAEHERVVIQSEKWKLGADWQPSQASNQKGVILLLHKAAGNRKIYTQMAKLLSERGYASLRVDLRGHGESTNIRKFDPTLSRYDNQDDPAIAANFKLIRSGYLDIIGSVKWLAKNKNLDNLPFVIIGSSYTGEEMVKASLETGWADAYIALAPGNFSKNSVTKIDLSKKPWLFVRAEEEMSFMDGIFENIKNGSNADIWMIPGKGHATDLFIENDGLELKLIKWIDSSLNLQVNSPNL